MRPPSTSRRLTSRGRGLPCGERCFPASGTANAGPRCSRCSQIASCGLTDDRLEMAPAYCSAGWSVFVRVHLRCWLVSRAVQPVADRIGDQLVFRVHVQLAKDVLDVVLNGLHCDEPLLGDLPILVALGDQAEDLAFGLCQQWLGRVLAREGAELVEHQAR